MADSTELLFGVVGRFSPRKDVLDGVQTPDWKGQFFGGGFVVLHNIWVKRCIRCTKMAELINLLFGMVSGIVY